MLLSLILLKEHKFYSMNMYFRFIHMHYSVTLLQVFIAFSENSTIIPKNQSCCGYSGYDNCTQLCTKNYKVINRPSRFSCNNGSLTKRRRVSRSICNTCLWRFRRIYREIKSGNQYVCKRHSRCYFISYKS